MDEKVIFLIRQKKLDETKNIIENKPELINCVSGPLPKNDCGQFMPLNPNNRPFMLGIKSKIEFMKALEVILNNCVYDTLEDRNIERKYLLYILTREEFKVGASIDEWINSYNKKMMEYSMIVFFFHQYR